MSRTDSPTPNGPSPSPPPTSAGSAPPSSTTAIDPSWVPEPVDADLTLTVATPAQAAGLLWHATTERPRLVQELIDYAGAGADAHLAKYTEACLTAARDDPEAEALFHAAMAHLAAWWMHSGR